MDAGSSCVIEVYYVLWIRFSGINTAGNDSLSHRDANCATEAFIFRHHIVPSLQPFPLQIFVDLSWVGQR